MLSPRLRCQHPLSLTLAPHAWRRCHHSVRAEGSLKLAVTAELQCSRCHQNDIMDTLECQKLHRWPKAWHRCHKSHDACMVPADGLLVLPCICSIALLLDLLPVRIARRLHPEVESQAQERFQQVGTLLSRWLAADVEIVDPHAAGAAAGSCRQ